MVLDFGLIQSSLFPDSENLGVGLGGEIDKKSIVESYNGQLTVIEGTSDISTFGTTFVDIDSMTYTIKQNGLYMVMFTMAVYTTNSGTTKTKFKMLKNAVNIGGAVAGGGVNVGTQLQYLTVTIPALVDLVTGDVVKVQWNTAENNNISYCYPTTEPDGYHRKLTVLRLWSTN